MFNKGKPYVPPPTRAMGSAHSHDDLHDINDELELATEVAEVTPHAETQASFSHAREDRGTSDAVSGGVIIAGPPADAPSLGTFAALDENTQAVTPTNGGSGVGIFGSNPSRATREASSVLGNGMTFEGDISGVGQLVIEGTVKGDVRVSQVLISEKGSVEGTVHADVLEVRGRVTGAIIAKQVHLHASARVEGDVTQEQLTVDRGAWFSGRSTQARREEEAAATAVATAEA